MKLTDLNPRFLGAGGEHITDKEGKTVPERTGVGLKFNCPCGVGSCYLAFSNPFDGGPPYVNPNQPTWQRTGDTFETLTLTPSIQRADPGGCRWHGFITNGEIVNA